MRTILREVVESKPLVGSSISIRAGFEISSYPIDIRFRSPPETPFFIHPPIIVDSHCYRASFSIILSTCLFISCPVSPSLILHENSNSSLVLQVSYNTSSCYTNAAILPKSPFYKLLPFTRTLPLQYEPPLKLHLWDRTLSNDVLPEPLGPRIATISPGFTKPAAQETTCLNIFLPLYSTRGMGSPFTGFEYTRIGWLTYWTSDKRIVLDKSLD